MISGWARENGIYVETIQALVIGGPSNVLPCVTVGIALIGILRLGEEVAEGCPGIIRESSFVCFRIRLSKLVTVLGSEVVVEGLSTTYQGTARPPFQESKAA